MTTALLIAAVSMSLMAILLALSYGALCDLRALGAKIVVILRQIGRDVNHMGVAGKPQQTLQAFTPPQGDGKKSKHNYKWRPGHEYGIDVPEREPLIETKINGREEWGIDGDDYQRKA